MLSRIYLVLAAVLMTCTPCLGNEGPYNVLFIISDDLTDTALSCYGNTVCQTPNIDAIAKQGCGSPKPGQGTYCGPSRASLMSGYYPHAIKMLGYKTPRPMIGDRMMWPEFFRQHGYYTAQSVSYFTWAYLAA